MRLCLPSCSHPQSRKLSILQRKWIEEIVLYRSTLSNHYHLLSVVGSLREGGQFSEFNVGFTSFSPSPLTVFLASKKFAIVFLVLGTMECNIEHLPEGNHF